MWNLVRQNQERIVVGAATSLVTLVLLACGREAVFGTQAMVATPAVASESTTSHVPRTPAYYAAQWHQIANEFYAAHPVESAKATPVVITASMRNRNNDTDDQTQVTTASHVAPKSKSNPLPSVTASPEPLAAGLRHQRTAVVGPPAVAAAFAAGGLACVLFGMVWPSVVEPQNHSLECSDSLRIELPRDWVQIRPSLRQRIKPIVVALSYLGAAIAAWTIAL